MNLMVISSQVIFLGGSGNYLPLTGGTLTGDLNGTGCNFQDYKSGGSFLWFFGKGVGSPDNAENYYGFLNTDYFNDRMVGLKYYLRDKLSLKSFNLSCPVTSIYSN